MTALYLNQEFSTWQEFFEAVEIHCRQTYQPFIKSSSKSCRCSNSRLKSGSRGYPPELGYVYFIYKCTHRGIFKSVSKGKRNVQSYKQGCQAKIYAAVDTETRSKIVVKQLNEEHCHEIGPDLFFQYTKQQRAFLPEEERKLRMKRNRRGSSKLSQLKVSKNPGQEVSKKTRRGLNRTYSEKTLSEAVSKIDSGSMQLGQASKVYDIPYTTLRSRLTSCHQDSVRTVLNDFEENKVAVWLLEMAKTGFHIGEEEIKEAVRCILRGQGALTKYAEDKPLKRWMLSFFGRHTKVSELYPSLLGESDEAEARPLTPAAWLSQMKTHLDTFDPTLLLSPDRLYAADELYFRLCPQGRKVIECEGADFVPSNTSELGISVVACASAAGHLLPPMCVFPFTEMPSYNPLEAYNSALFQISSQGQLTSCVFLSWLRDSFIPAVALHQKPVVLFVDALQAHFTNVDITDICMQHGVVLYCVDNSCAGLVPPLEQPFLKHIHQVWTIAVGPGVVLRTEHASQQPFASVLKSVWSQKANDDLAVHGFARSGIYPFDLDFEKTIGLDGVGLDQSIDSPGETSAHAGPVQPKREAQSPPSDADTDPMDHLLVTQAIREGIASGSYEQNFNEVPRSYEHESSEVQLLPNTLHGAGNSGLSQDLLPPSVSVVFTQEQHLEASESQTSHFTHSLKQPFPVTNSLPWVTQPPPLPLPSIASRNINTPSQSPSLYYIKLLLQMAFSYGEAISMDVLDKYAVGTPVASYFQDMVDILNTLLKLENLGGSQPLAQGRDYIDHSHSGSGIPSQFFIDQSQPDMLTCHSFNPSQPGHNSQTQFFPGQLQARSCTEQIMQCPSDMPDQGSFNRVQTQPDVLRQHPTEQVGNQRGAQIQDYSLQCHYDHHDSPTQKVIPTLQHRSDVTNPHCTTNLQPSRFAQVCNSEKNDPSPDQLQTEVTLPVALTGKAFAIYLDVKRKERVAKIKTEKGAVMVEKDKEGDKKKVGKRKKGQSSGEKRKGGKKGRKR